MKIDHIRIYAEVLEQGLDFKEYIRKTGFRGRIMNVYTKKARGEFKGSDSLVDRIRKVKDIDVLITAVCNGEEYPLIMVEYSTAVPTDDHRMQRSDVYFWGALFGTPVMKISPSDKGMDQGFGGGSRFSDDFERVIAYRKGAVLYQIDWDIPKGGELLPTKPDALSCIEYSSEIFNIISSLLNAFEAAGDYGAYYNALYSEYGKRHAALFASYTDDKLKALLSDSARFQWNGDALCAKINRFGHAMDPDRGILYFVNMLVGAENTVTEIQVNRSSVYNTRGGYGSLFDALPRERQMREYVEDIIRTKNNIFSEEDAIYVFLHALNLENDLDFKKVSPRNYIIEDEALLSFLKNHSSMTPKSIFYLSTQLKLTDKYRRTICSIKWNEGPIKEYLRGIKDHNFSPIQVQPLSSDTAKEDIVTFASAELYRRAGFKLLAVSYPGAQGDRCILTGHGRGISRTYVDVIAYKETPSGLKVHLGECKDMFARSAGDVAKLKEIICDTEKLSGLAALVRKAESDLPIESISISVAAKTPSHLPSFDVDCIFHFGLSQEAENTVVDYSLEIYDPALAQDFLPLAEDGKNLKGRITLDKLYVVAG